jgi:hypothetical protein
MASVHSGDDGCSGIGEIERAAPVKSLTFRPPAAVRSRTTGSRPGPTLIPVPEATMPDMQDMGGGVATIQKYLSGINFPVEKQQLIEHVRQQDPPQEVVSTLEKLDDQRYESPADVSEAITGKLM